MDRFERISPDRTYICELERHREECKEELKHIRKVSIYAPPGRLRIHQGQYFQVLPESKPRYLKKSEEKLIKGLAQKTYDRAVAQRLKRELPLLDKLIALNKSRPVRAIWEHFKEARRSLIEPVTLSDAAYATRWRGVQYKRMGFKAGEPVFQTKSGIRMRSKSELLIAALLDECGIPYRYEYPFLLEDKAGCTKRIRPDFYCLEPVTRTEFVWEHFGRMDDAAYRERAEEKLMSYSFSGAFGQGLCTSGADRKRIPLLVTFEEKGLPLDMALTREKLIRFVRSL